MSKQKKVKGFTVIDIIVGTALVSIIFLGVFGLFRLGTKVVGQSRAKIVATSIANEYMEKIRSLPYESVGVSGGFPDGILENSTTTIRNGLTFTIETRVDYIIDGTDGIASPEDDCPNDYKKAEVKITWSGGYRGELMLVSNFTPETLVQECADEGGILSISAFDAYGLMVPSPLIEIRDISTDNLLKSATPDNGQHYFSLNSSTSYKVVVSKPGFSTERTYGIDDVADPDKPHPWVFEDKLTEYFMSIDETSTLSIETSSPWGEDYFYDSFINSDKLASTTNILVASGNVSLSRNPGVYFLDGNLDNNLCSFPGNNGDCAQSFTTENQAKQISAVQLFIKKGTTTPSDIYVEIRSSSTTGPLLASSSLKIGPTLPINFEWIDFTFSSPINLGANTQYFLRLRSSPDSVSSQGQGPVLWGYLSSTSSPPGYNGGQAFRYVGKNQEVLSDCDFSFKIYDDEYASSGSLVSSNIFPNSLNSWEEFSWDDSEPANTNLIYRIYYASGTEWIIIPDSDLTGNTAGFDISPVDLSSLSTAAYDQLRIKADLSTSDNSLSSSLYEWQISWITESSTPIPNVTFVLRGNKTIGDNAAEEPVYKYFTTSTSDGSGTINITNMEWDNYTFSVPSSENLDLIDIDPSPQPISLPPDNVIQNVVLFLEANDSLLLNIRNDDTLGPIFAAEARLYNTGLSYDNTQQTDTKGQTYFIPLETAVYNLEVDAPGYLSTSTTISVSGDIIKTIRLEQIE